MQKLNSCVKILGDTVDNGEKLWKQGGRFFRDCIVWTLSTTGNEDFKGAG